MADTVTNPGAAGTRRGGRLALTLRAMRHRNFQLFFSGQMISLIGTWMQTVASSWLVYRLTGSSLLLGVVGFAEQFPVFVLSPVGGLVADRKKRQYVIICTQFAAMILAFIFSALTLAKMITKWEIIVLALLLGTVNAFDIPARQAFIVEMVGREDLMNAIALNSSMFNGARILGPAIAGILVASIGEGWCFFANAVSYIAVIIGLFLMKIDNPFKLAKHNSALENLREGFRFCRNTLPIRSLLLLLGLVSLVGMPYAVLMPIFADHILHSGARGLGILMTSTGVGALSAGMMLASREGVRGLGKWVAMGAAGFGASLILFSFSRMFWLSVVLLLPVGFSFMVQMASSNTLIQTMVPDQLRGRVMSVYSMMFIGMAPFGALFAGAIAEHLGAPITLAIGGVACLLGAGAFAMKLPVWRGEARQLVLAQAVAGGDPAQEMTMGAYESEAE